MPHLLIVARHAESEASARGVLNGRPEAGVGLTPLGREQARALEAAVASLVPGGPALVAATPFPRTQQTAELAAGRAPALILPGLSDPDFGAWEGRSLEEYRSWALAAPPAEPCPGGGESRAAIAARLAAAWRELLARPEDTVLVVCHSLPVRYLLDAVDGLAPAPKAGRVPYAEPYALTAAQVAAAAELLAAWARAPRWRT